MQSVKRVMALGFCVLATTGCAPPLDWREVRPPGSALLVQFPCRPASHARRVALAGQSFELTLWACSTDAATWALAWIEGVDPRLMTQVLAEWRQASAGNLGAAAGPLQPIAIRGATPNAQAGHSRQMGRRPDGVSVTQDLVVFAFGTRAYQATVLSAKADTAAIDQFFAEMRLPG